MKTFENLRSAHHAALEPDLVADSVAALLQSLVGNTLRDGNGGDPSGLGAHDVVHCLTGRMERGIQDKLRHLGCFAATKRNVKTC